MEMPQAKWLKQYGIFVFAVSIIETGILAPGNLFEKLSLSAFSLMAVFLGFAISVFILGFCFVLPRVIGSKIGYQHMQNSRFRASPKDEPPVQYRTGEVASAPLASMAGNRSTTRQRVCLAVSSSLTCASCLY